MSALSDTTGSSKRRVAYFYDAEVGEYSYGCNTVFKPHRVRMTHNLVLSYDLFKAMDVYQAPSASSEQMQAFHSKHYLDFLAKITPSNMQALPPKEMSLMVGYGLGDEQPIFPGVYKYTSAVTGASLSGASLLNAGQADIAINWSGGMHHAKKSAASGFCYVNDCVLAILELLKSHTRVLYIDIDVHHGDGVEEAFYCTNRVMTLSFHYFAKGFFPTTGGSMQATGEGLGQNCALNFPFKEGIDDDSFRSVFQATVAAVMTHYRPDAIVLQCGADSLAGDRLGRAAKSNISMKGHAECVTYVKKIGLPTLVLGGGGYTLRNVPRCWANETGELLGITLENTIPEKNAYRRYFGPNYELRLPALKDVKNANSPAYLQRALKTIIETIKASEGAPGIQFGDRLGPEFPFPSKRSADDDIELQAETSRSKSSDD